METVDEEVIKIPIPQENVVVPPLLTPSADLPFGCDLCPERFHKKLLLNNHMERRHGIKFVFTQKGQKVKLVRMPEVMQDGEKLDPCVKLLLQNGNLRSGKNILGVQAVDTPDQQIQYQSQLHHEINIQELLKNKDVLGMGFLIANINFPALITALKNEETPFVAFSPYNSDKLYLLSIIQMNSSRQLLYPTTQNILEKSLGVTMEDIVYYVTKSRESSTPPKTTDTQSTVQPPSEKTKTEEVTLDGHNQSADEKYSGSEINNQNGLQNTVEDTKEGILDSVSVDPPEPKKKTKRVFSHVAVVAIMRQIMDTETGVCKLQLEPAPLEPLQNVCLCKPKDFVRFGIQCKVKRLRCFSETTSLITPPPPPPTTVKEQPKPKRKYVRKSTIVNNNQDSIVEEVAEPADEKVTPYGRVDRKRKKPATDEENSEEDDDDVTYKPGRQL